VCFVYIPTNPPSTCLVSRGNKALQALLCSQHEASRATITTSGNHACLYGTSPRFASHTAYLLSSSSSSILNRHAYSKPQLIPIPCLSLSRSRCRDPGLAQHLRYETARVHQPIGRCHLTAWHRVGFINNNIFLHPHPHLALTRQMTSGPGLSPGLREWVRRV
jgi:hypothetical protein